MKGLFEFREETNGFYCIILSHHKEKANVKPPTAVAMTAPPHIYPRLDNTWVTLEVFTDL